MTTMTRDRATAAQERDRIMGSRNEFWRPEDLATSGSTTLHLLADLVDAGELRRIRRGLYWRGNKTPLGMSYPRTELVIAELAPGPGVGPTGLDASNRLRVSTQVPRKAHIAVPRRAPESTHDIDFYARPARRARVEAELGSGEVALLEALDQWERTVEVPPGVAWERFRELIRNGQLRADHLARGSQTEPGKVRARLRALLESLGEHALAEQIPMPDHRTTDSALAILRSAAWPSWSDGPREPDSSPRAGRLALSRRFTMTVETTSDAERRQRAIADARRSSELEGSRSSDATRADQDAYVRGEIDVEQLGQRVRARYGLA